MRTTVKVIIVPLRCLSLLGKLWNTMTRISRVKCARGPEIVEEEKEKE